ncbi:MAG: hypothetical protein Q9220_000925 [cf. Caloplaca sp. 1 TL-2023]
MGFRFLDLPPEIRDHIYHDILSCSNARIPPADDNDPASYKFDLSILLANKQVYHEAKRAFQDNIFIKITTPWSESIDHISSEGRVPIITIGDKAEKFHTFHLWLWIDAPGLPPRAPAYSMVICLDDLPAFTRMWHFSNLNHHGLNEHLRLKLTLQDPHLPDRKIPRSLQTRLLLPFGLVKGLHAFSVQGAKVLPSVEDALKKDQAIPDPSPEQCIETATALKDAGNKALQAGDFATALEQYTAAFAAIHITVQGRKRYIHADGYYLRELTSGPLKGQRSDFARLILRVKLVANIIQTYLKMREWDEARFWGRRSIMLFRSSFTRDVDADSEEELEGDWQGRQWDWMRESASMGFPARWDMGKIMYRTALASRELGMGREAGNLIRAAAIYLPHDEIVQGEKRGLDQGGKDTGT